MLPAELAALLAQAPLDPYGYQCVPRPLDARLKHNRWGGSDKRRTVAETEYRFLVALAASGWSMRQALLEAITWDAAAGGPRVTKLDGVYEQAARHLAAAGLWETTGHALGQANRATGAAPRTPGSRAVLVRLTPAGRAALGQIGVTAVEDEWSRIERLHKGAQAAAQPAHTAAICAFAYHARRRGYATVVCPELTGVTLPNNALGPGLAPHPDCALPTWPGGPLHTEVQRGDSGSRGARRAKWSNLFQLQGLVAICAATPAQARRYAAEAQAAKASHGLVTDLVSLCAGQRWLWTYEWFGFEPLERYRPDEAG